MSCEARKWLKIGELLGSRLVIVKIIFPSISFGRSVSGSGQVFRPRGYWHWFSQTAVQVECWKLQRCSLWNNHGILFHCRPTGSGILVLSEPCMAKSTNVLLDMQQITYHAQDSFGLITRMSVEHTPSTGAIRTYGNSAWVCRIKNHLYWIGIFHSRHLMRNPNQIMRSSVEACQGQYRECWINLVGVHRPPDISCNFVWCSTPDPLGIFWPVNLLKFIWKQRCNLRS